MVYKTDMVVPEHSPVRIKRISRRKSSAKWSARKTFLFVLITSVLLWAGIIAGILWLV